MEACALPKRRSRAKEKIAMTEIELLDPPAETDLDLAVTEGVAATRSLEHRKLRRDEFWRAIPAYAEVASNEFHTHTFQSRNTVTNVRQLNETLRHLAPASFYEDVIEGL